MLFHYKSNISYIKRGGVVCNDIPQYSSQTIGVLLNKTELHRKPEKNEKWGINVKKVETKL